MLRDSKWMVAMLMLAAVTARAGVQRFESKMERTIAWRGGPISIDHQFGSVSVVGSSDDHVVVRSTIRSSEPDLVKKIAVIVTEVGTGVSIRTELPAGKIQGTKQFSYSIDYRIQVPERAQLKVENRFGSIDVTGMEGRSELINSQGSISMRDMSGPVAATNQFGSISLSSADGSAVLRNQNGSIQARDVDGKVDVANRFGSINLATIGDNATVRNTNGSVDIRDANGDLDVNNAFGSLIVTSVDGSVRATGTNGRMELRDIRGNVTVTHAYGDVALTSVGGSVSVSGQNVRVEGRDIRHNAAITSTYGGVTLNDVGGNVSVRASFSPAHALDELAPDARVDRCGQREPEARQARAQEGHRDQKAAKTSLAGILEHEVGVRDLVRASDLEDAFLPRREIQRAHEIGDDVLDGDRLRFHPYPARGDHHRQALHEGTDQLEGQASGSHDDRRAQLDDGHAGCAQGLSGRVTTPQVRREVLVAATQAPKVDDALDPGG